MRIAIIGCGGEGERFAHAARQLGWHVAVCADVDERRAKRLAKFVDAAPASRCNAVIGQKKIDAVILAAPTPSHTDYVERAANAKKPVLCAAPFTLDPRSANKAWTALKRSHTPCYVAYDGRVGPEYDALAARMSSGPWFARSHRTAPMPRGVKGWYREHAASGGPTACDLSHEMDWLLKQIGPIRTLYCQVLRRPTTHSAQITLTFQNKSIAQLNASWTARRDTNPHQTLEVCGSEGMVRYDSADTTFSIASGPQDTPDANPSRITPAERHLRRFADRIGAAKPTPDAFQHDLLVVEALAAAIRSANSGKAVAVAKGK